MGFNPLWLDERFEHDLRARNQSVQDACFAHFESLDHINIVDVGSGTGSTFLALHSKINKDQTWTFIEEDPELINHSIKRIQNTLSSYGYHITKENGTFTFANSQHQIDLKTINNSLLNIESLVDLKNTELITASAIFDLFSADQYNAFAQLIHGYDVAILSVLNYTGMRFSPERDADQSFIDLYNAHMRRPQEFGVGMGAQCQKDIEAIYDGMNKKVVSGESIWNLSAEHKTMHSMILDYMQDGVGAMTQQDNTLDDWLSEKRKLSESGNLNIQVNHFDYFVI